jgi:phosphoenolpyruvate carboxylase
MTERAQQDRKSARPSRRQAHHIDQVIDLLHGLLEGVIRLRQPAVRGVLDADFDDRTLSHPDMISALQALGIWLQLLNIAEENTAMRSRRRIETSGGPDAVMGSFSNVLSDVAALGATPETLAAALERFDVSPTLTAHPTEAKRVTVLKIHRRIYRKLVELETQRWTPRERDRFVRELAAEIDLLWMSGELRRERPNLDQEIAWGLHFFREVLFEAAPQLYESLAAALLRHYPEGGGRFTPFLRFSSWIGGDRDGNPHVTVAVTRRALAANRQAALERYRQGLSELTGVLSLSANLVEVPPAFMERHAGALAASGRAESLSARNPAELFRQFVAAL